MKTKTIKRIYWAWSIIYDPFKRLWQKIFYNSENDLKAFFKKNLNNKTILELGCGTAINLEKIYALNLKFKNYLGLDLSPDMLAKAKAKFSEKNVKFKQKDVTKLDNKKYDVIISTWMLSHIDSPSILINKTQKLLKKNGKMFLLFYSKPKWYVRFWFSPFARLFSSSYVTKEEIKKFKNVKSVNSYGANTVTTVYIKK